MKQLIVTLTVVLLSSCGGSEKTTTDDIAVNEKVKVKLSQVRTQPVDQIEEFTATVEAEIKNNIAPSSPLRIDRIFVEVGDAVSKGQKLVQMDQSTLLQSRSQLENLKVEFERVDELYKVGGVSKSEWDAMKVNLDVAQTAYKNLEENTLLLSPINGIVTARNYDNGDLYSGTPVLTVEQITPVKLMINVSEKYYAQVKKGMPADITLDVYGNEKFAGKVNLVYPTVDATTRTFPVEVQLANSDRRVRPGMFARVNISMGINDRVVVPDQAIIKQMGSAERFVYVYNNNGTVTYNKVELGRRLGDSYELISGVENGAQVVIAGQIRLSDGVEVTVE